MRPEAKPLLQREGKKALWISKKKFNFLWEWEGEMRSSSLKYSWKQKVAWEVEII
jgi:hypothetical protein